jgi:hypothetical protein
VKKTTREIVSGHRYLIGAGIIIIGIIGIAYAAILTLTIIPDQPGTPGAVYPYSTTFLVSFPEGEGVKIGSLDILALQTGSRMALRIGDKREEMMIGEEREITNRNATIAILGRPVFQTGYRLKVTWTGMGGKRALFHITMETSRQVPDWMISRIIPEEIQASPA